MKRQCFWPADVAEPRNKVFLTERLVNENDPLYMQQVYEKTNAMLFQGAKKNFNAAAIAAPEAPDEVDLYCEEDMESDFSAAEWVEPSLTKQFDPQCIQVYDLNSNNLLGEPELSKWGILGESSKMANNHPCPMHKFKDDKVSTLIKGARKLPTPIKGGDNMYMSKRNLGMDLNEGIGSRRYHQMRIDKMFGSKSSDGNEEALVFEDANIKLNNANGCSNSFSQRGPPEFFDQNVCWGCAICKPAYIDSQIDQLNEMQQPNIDQFDQDRMMDF